MLMSPQRLEIQTWPIDWFVFYARRSRKNDVAVDRMCSSIREFGVKGPRPGTQRHRGRGRAAPP